MTDEQIVEKSLERVIINGWRPSPYFKNHPLKIFVFMGTIQFYSSEEAKKQGVLGVDPLSIKYYELIFSHDFAKAFWSAEGQICPIDEKRWHSKKVTCEACGNDKPQSEWQYHLQQMVLEENPLKYLEKFL